MEMNTGFAKIIEDVINKYLMLPRRFVFFFDLFFFFVNRMIIK